MNTKGSCKKACLLALFFAFLSFLPLAAQTLDNLNFTLNIDDTIEQRGFKVRRQNLDSADSGIFPQNLIIEIP
ncbi:MAG: hypothetical protein II030_07220, partial [Treponema sp.]|nr:hypothetical protein [Treponema sp.]